MKSTDYNINNPTSVDLITLQRSVESWQYPTIKPVTKEEYDLIQIKDPFTFYVIKDNFSNPMKRPTIYMGDHLVSFDEDVVRYMLGINKHGEYEIYMDTVGFGYDKLIPIRRYPSAQQAINDLTFFNNVGSHTDYGIRTYRILLSYINREISLNDTLIGILSAFGFRDSVEIQEVIQTGIKYGCTHVDIDIPVYYRDMLPVLREHTKNFLVKKYANLYDLIVKWDFFKDEKFKDAQSGIDLSTEVREVTKVMTEYVGM